MTDDKGQSVDHVRDGNERPLWIATSRGSGFAI
jgi:hypothetical protein